MVSWWTSGFFASLLWGLAGAEVRGGGGGGGAGGRHRNFFFLGDAYFEVSLRFSVSKTRIMLISLQRFRVKVFQKFAELRKTKR